MVPETPRSLLLQEELRKITKLNEESKRVSLITTYGAILNRRRLLRTKTELADEDLNRLEGALKKNGYMGADGKVTCDGKEQICSMNANKC